MQIVYRNIRFSAKVDRCLRRRWRMHGDLSIRVRSFGANLTYRQHSGISSETSQKDR